MSSRKGKEIIYKELMDESTDKSVVPKISRIPTYKLIVRDSDVCQIQESPAGTSESNSKAAKCELELTHPRFGPLYTIKQEAVDAIKQKAWEHVLSKSPDRPGNTTEIYLDAMRKVEREAMDMYAGMASPEGSEFRWMMIKDGCFFLQLALVMVGCGERLGYPEKDPIFGREQKKEDSSKWIFAMVHVGNQIPLLVLRALIEQTFFKEAIATARWDRPPSGSFEKFLYDILILPSLGRNLQGRTFVERLMGRWRTFVERLMGRGPRGNDVEKQQQPHLDHDLLHGYLNFILGPPTQYYLISQYEDDEDDDYDTIIASPLDDDGGHTGNRKRIFPSATELKQRGIYLKLNSGGARGILFRSRYFWANVYLPALLVDENTELVLGNLMNYENIHQSEQSGRELRSYVRLMGDLIQTKADAILLYNKGIIQGELANVKRLPAMFKRLASEDTTLTQELRRLRSEISDYTSPLVQYKGVLSLVALFSFIQTFFTVLGYFNPPQHS